MAHTGRPWTAEEDQLLIQAVAVHGEIEQWKAVAQCVPGRTNKACRKRWLHSLSPTVKKSSWTHEEDQTLLSLYAIHGMKWSLIARHIPGRTDDACSKRYREALNPSLRKDEWTEEEDQRLLNAYARLGGKWGHIGQELRRSGLGCRNRWRMIERKKASALRKNSSSGEPLPGPSTLSEQQDWPQVPVYSQYWDPNTNSYDAPRVLDTGMPEPALSNSSYPHQAPSSTFNTSDVRHVSYPYASSSSLDHAMYLSSDRMGVGAVQQSSPLIQPRSRTAATMPTHLVVHHDTSSPIVNYGQHSVPSPTFNPRNPSVLSSTSPQMAQGFMLPLERHQVGVGHQDRPVAIHPLDTDHGYRAPYPNGVSALPRPVDFQHESPHATRERVAAYHVESADSATTSAALSPNEHFALSSSIPADSPPPQSSSSHAPHYQAPVRSRPKTNPQKKRANTDGRTPRLSASLPISSDPAVLPYACGNKRCWPGDTTTSTARFATSGELSDHHRTHHDGEMISDETKPFRCALDGCGKSWKSVNGLQYHLQVSRAHFREAMSAVRTQPGADDEEIRRDNDNEDYPALAPSTRDVIHKKAAGSGDENKKPRKTFECPHEGCMNRYKQLSGLRYHLVHGHSRALPEQVNSIPPALARKIAEQSGSIDHEDA